MFKRQTFRREALPRIRCVAGNHDLIVLGRLTHKRCIPLARASLRSTRQVLDGEARGLLSGLPLGARVQDGARLIAGEGLRLFVLSGQRRGGAPGVAGRATISTQLSTVVAMAGRRRLGSI